jgi:hypothetical protein
LRARAKSQLRERARDTDSSFVVVRCQGLPAIDYAKVAAFLGLSCTLVYNELDPQSPPQIFVLEPDRSTCGADFTKTILDSLIPRE